MRELAKEYPLPNEEELIRTLLAMREKRVERARSGVYVRESHPKHHGCVQARFVVEPDLPEELRVGVFAEPRAYDARIRFSNANGLRRDGTYRPDGRPDLRGMAIKLDVDGTTQDFLLISATALPARDLADFVAVLGEFRLLGTLGYFFNPRHPRLRELAIALRAVKRYANPLDIRYSTVVPFLLGDQAVRYEARPVGASAGRAPWRAPPDFLREAMRERLSAGDARFEFRVQVQTDADAMPVEDPSVVWDSSFRTVATIEIPAQSFDSAEQMAACENLSFNPWHTLPEHRPLGGLNRARRVVYPALTQLRHDRNHVPVDEP